MYKALIFCLLFHQGKSRNPIKKAKLIQISFEKDLDFNKKK